MGDKVNERLRSWYDKQMHRYLDVVSDMESPTTPPVLNKQRAYHDWSKWYRDEVESKE
jgi:hypothetical protein